MKNALVKRSGAALKGAVSKYVDRSTSTRTGFGTVSALSTGRPFKKRARFAKSVCKLNRLSGSRFMNRERRVSSAFVKTYFLRSETVSVFV